MKSIDQWRDPDLAKEYTDKATNPSINWYEYEVNLPDFLSLIPKAAKSILDFGSGPGDVTAIITKQFPNATVDGCDASKAMLDLAKQQSPSINFFKWDGIEPIPDKEG